MIFTLIHVFFFPVTLFFFFQNVFPYTDVVQHKKSFQVPLVNFSLTMDDIPSIVPPTSSDSPILDFSHPSPHMMYLLLLLLIHLLIFILFLLLYLLPTLILLLLLFHLLVFFIYLDTLLDILNPLQN